MIFRRKHTTTVIWHFIEYRGGLPYAAERTECWHFPSVILGRKLGRFTVTATEPKSGPFALCE